MIVGLTGHRPNKLGGYNEFNPIRIGVLQRLREILLKLKATQTISGMALGFDQDAFELSLAMAIPVTAAIPFRGQENKWSLEAKKKYRSLLQFAAKVEVVNAGGYAAWKLHDRNRWIVNHCEVLVGAWDGSHGGTESCVKYAQRVHRHTILIDPREFIGTDIKLRFKIE